MEKQKVTSNDVLEALSIRLNDTIRPNRNKDKKNNAYFWIFKFAFLLIYVFLISIVLNEVKDIGSFLIYETFNSLRSILSGFWIVVISLMKHLIILYLMYSHFKIFSTSSYYKTLYQNERKMLKVKKKTTKIINKIFKVLATVYLVLFMAMALVSLTGFIYIICMVFDGVYIISLSLIFLIITIICLLLFKHIRNKFFENSNGVDSKYVVALFVMLVLSVVFFVFETRSFKHSETLPLGFKTETKEVVFDLKENQNFYIGTDSKLNNIEIIEDKSLNGKVRVEVDYYKTAKVEYKSTLNDKDDLIITFTSDLMVNKVNPMDILKIFTATISNKNIYNYNLFKYPNIRVYVNKLDTDSIKVK